MEFVLGSILFIIHVNDLDSNLLSKVAKFFNDPKLKHKDEPRLDCNIIQQELN